MDIHPLATTLGRGPVYTRTHDVLTPLAGCRVVVLVSSPRAISNPMCTCVISSPLQQTLAGWPSFMGSSDRDNTAQTQDSARLVISIRLSPGQDRMPDEHHSACPLQVLKKSCRLHAFHVPAEVLCCHCQTVGFSCMACCCRIGNGVQKLEEVRIRVCTWPVRAFWAWFGGSVAKSVNHWKHAPHSLSRTCPKVCCKVA